MIQIRKTVNADSRTAQKPPTVEELREATISHKADVKNAMNFIMTQISSSSESHDHTKIENMDEFHAALNSGRIKDTLWYQKHITEERHHLKSHVPKDVTLIDVIEHLCDCTMAGLARSGEVYDTDISPDVLVLACQNTVELLKKNTTVIEDDVDLMNQPLASNFLKSSFK